MISLAAASIDELNCGNTFSAAAMTLTAIAVTVRLPPAASTCFAKRLRTSSRFVMSQTSCWVTWGIVVQATLRCSAVLRRTARIGWRSTSPQREKSGSGSETTPPAADGAAEPALATRRLAGALVVNGEDRLSHFDFVACLDLDFLDFAGDRRGHFDRRLVGFELEDRLILGDGVARLHEHAQDVAAGDVLTKFRQVEVGHEKSPPRWRRTRTEVTASREGLLCPRCGQAGSVSVVAL